MRETDIQNLIRLELSKHGTFFRANVGQTWTGDDVIRLEGGNIILKNARPFNTGLPPGFSDLFGIIPITITHDMINKKIGLFAAIEVKTPAGRIRPEQENFIGIMKARGARAGIARSVEDAVAIVTGQKQQRGDI
ncbi:VRR-NUC domain-containing protein [Sporomusa sphaeroides]|uniref:VRR-NUC domain protein n=1 Tax=Sporomusa sphaeroides DSM 2875 TaxID=1337886 RepID=A0ABP2C4P3_9FIRM|nr:VRR-NUC domain-containing protein [Sporomusa sphaeroides]OLS56396.1 VRR-NUC domain protein [Sporomusa sphaeroides DSM 2875]CVK18491.1 VRR-NUC domain protein [Sporomusa sphaeroides DSM 2875]